MMKVLLSSKYLANELAKIDFDDETVVQIRSDRNSLIIETYKQSIYLEVEIMVQSPMIKQTDRRWDWVKSLVTKVDEQPIVLVIHESFVNVVFQY